MRGLLYLLARLLGDVNAIKKDKVGRRVKNRAAARALGKVGFWGKLWK